jgi:hypothetical protein
MKDSVIVLLILLCQERRGQQDRYCEDDKTNLARLNHRTNREDLTVYPNGKKRR